MAWDRAKNVPAFGISLSPKFVSQRMQRFFGTTIEREAIKYNKGQHMKNFEQHLKIWSQDAFQMLTVHTGLKIQDSLERSIDPTSRKKFKPLARKTVAARMVKGKNIMGPTHPLIDSGKLYQVAGGFRSRNRGGNSSSGSVSKDGVRLQTRVNYRLGETQMAGSFYWQLSGPKVRHLYGFSQVFENVRLRGPKSGRMRKYEAQVPARPYVPKFTNSYFQRFKSQLNKTFKQNMIATEKSSTAIVKSYGYVEKFK
jgi:hypothetical protein